MKTVGIKLSLYVNYFVFAILLNSVGIVILKSIHRYGVREVEASVLEAYKDLPIAIVSFMVASFLPRIGYKRAMLAALALVCFCVYLHGPWRIHFLRPRFCSAASVPLSR